MVDQPHLAFGPFEHVVLVDLDHRQLTPLGVEGVTLPGQQQPLTFRRTGTALEVDLPPALRNRIGVALILSGDGLTQGSLGDYHET